MSSNEHASTGGQVPRDPLKDPRVGDVIASPAWGRCEVIKLADILRSGKHTPHVWFQSDRLDMNRPMRTWSLGGWQLQMADATVEVAV